MTFPLAIKMRSVCLLISTLAIGFSGPARKQNFQNAASLQDDETDPASKRSAPEALAKLVGETLDYVPELRAAGDIAAAGGMQLAVYGGTTRELLRFVSDKMTQLGGADAYRVWLKSANVVHLLDFHRLKSDLDLMLVGAEGQKIDREARRTLASEIARVFPGGAFYASLDITDAEEFFQKFSAEREHLEPVSNIPINRDGAVHEWADSALMPDVLGFQAEIKVIELGFPRLLSWAT